MNSVRNIYLCGVGGQGIALLNEVLLRACARAGHQVRGVETHGLAQRGGTVRAHLRLGEAIHTPRIPDGEADLVVALERLEAIRGTIDMLKPGGTLLYYDTIQQPTLVRAGATSYPATEALLQRCQALGARVERLQLDEVPEKQQNVALLARLGALGLIDRVDGATIRAALEEVLPPHALEKNLAIVERIEELPTD
ncbi:MAG: 2-oxoacid:acceptor oxidoreductase family protein [Myxococcota bacterium]|jgi:indolepyruvate ferredoxin oxidoreductase beta subunit|nr:2-oxoacid:acceptor oxidoreductase family protein [Myxococcota bacterium]